MFFKNIYIFLIKNIKNSTFAVPKPGSTVRIKKGSRSDFEAIRR